MRSFMQFACVFLVVQCITDIVHAQLDCASATKESLHWKCQGEKIKPRYLNDCKKNREMMYCKASVINNAKDTDNNQHWGALTPMELYTNKTMLPNKTCISITPQVVTAVCAIDDCKLSKEDILNACNITYRKCGDVFTFPKTKKEMDKTACETEYNFAEDVAVTNSIKKDMRGSKNVDCKAKSKGKWTFTCVGNDCNANVSLAYDACIKEEIHNGNVSAKSTSNAGTTESSSQKPECSHLLMWILVPVVGLVALLLGGGGVFVYMKRANGETVEENSNLREEKVKLEEDVEKLVAENKKLTVDYTRTNGLLEQSMTERGEDFKEYARSLIMVKAMGSVLPAADRKKLDELLMNNEARQKKNADELSRYSKSTINVEVPEPGKENGLATDSREDEKDKLLP